MTSSFLVSKVSFTCWKVQNFLVQIELTNLLAKQKGYQFNLENTIVSFLYWVGSNYITEIETETETETEIIY